MPANRPFDVSHYQIRLTLDPRKDPQTFDASLRIKGTATKATPFIELDAENLNILEAAGARNKKVTWETSKKGVIRFLAPAKKGEKFTLDIRYQGKIGAAHQGLFKVTDPDEPERGPLYFTHFEALGARHFFPCNDEPYDKASTEVIVTVPQGYRALSNGEVSHKKSTVQGEAWEEFHWQLAKPQATYLVALAVGKFEKLEGKHGDLALPVWMGTKSKARAKFTVEATEKSMLFLEDYLGVKYPWPQYATVGLPTFVWGGMENTASTHMNQDRVLLNDPNSAVEKKRITALVAHELAHQWFGNSVTMKWWDDLWLNEAFASRMETLTTQSIFNSNEAELDFLIDTWNDYFRQEDGPRSHPIVDAELLTPDDAFDSINYTKGENVLRMLQYFMGEEAFQTGVKEYLTQFAYANADYKDFFKVMGKVSKIALGEFRDTWLLQAGYPIISWNGQWDSKTSTYTLNLRQKSNHAKSRSIFNFALPVVFNRKAVPAYSTPQRVDFKKGTHSVSVKLPAAPEWVTVNDRSTVLAKVLASEAPQTYVVQALEDPHPINRVWAGYQLALPFIDGEELAPERVKALVTLFQTDPSPYVRNAVLGALGKGKAKVFPKELGEALYRLTEEATAPRFSLSADYRENPHGWSQWRSRLLGALGKNANPNALILLKGILLSDKSPLDDLSESALAAARTGQDEVADLLAEAITVQSSRSYRFRFSVWVAYGSYENKKAAALIRKLTETAGSDLVGRMSWNISENETLRRSTEWADTLSAIVLTSDRFDDEVKTRLLHTVEELKLDHIKALFESIKAEGKTERIRHYATTILGKTFK